MFKKDGFNSRLYSLVQIKQHFFKCFCLKMHISLNNAVFNCLKTVKIDHNLARVHLLSFSLVILVRFFFRLATHSTTTTWLSYLYYVS